MEKCTDCGGQLEKGAMLDFIPGGTLVQRYAESDNIPNDSKNLPLGLRVNEASFKNVRRVLAYRCTKCNKIHTYAQETVTISSLNARSKKGILIALLIFALVVVVALALRFIA